MVTKTTPDSSEKESPSPPVSAADRQQTDPGFFALLVKSIFEPGANAAVVMAMNLSFFFLVLTLFALAFLTGWNKHVLMLFGVTILLWGSMAWFVLELTKVQSRPDNMPPAMELVDDSPSDPVQPVPEPRKDR
ncbi:hypothetical protein IAU60_005029 [Kwoniella sp. DSM 27419]